VHCGWLARKQPAAQLLSAGHGFTRQSLKLRLRCIGAGVQRLRNDPNRIGDSPPAEGVVACRDCAGMAGPSRYLGEGKATVHSRGNLPVCGVTLSHTQTSICASSCNRQWCKDWKVAPPWWEPSRWRPAQARRLSCKCLVCVCSVVSEPALAVADNLQSCNTFASESKVPARALELQGTTASGVQRSHAPIAGQGECILNRGLEGRHAPKTSPPPPQSHAPQHSATPCVVRAHACAPPTVMLAN